MKTLVIIPAYNEALNIEKTMKDLKENSSFDYIIINDCSKDNTRDVCEKNNYKFISLPVNYGLASGVQVGMKYAFEKNYDIAIQFDGDGQHSAKFLSNLASTIENGEADIAIGSRFVTEKKGLSPRMIGSRVISFFIKVISRKKINDPTSGMRAYNKAAIAEFAKNSSLTPEPDTMVYFIKRGYKIKEIQVQMSEREFGESYLNLWKSIQYMLSITFSIVLIRAFTKKRKKGEVK